jgi:uncharacterized membrane protein
MRLFHRFLLEQRFYSVVIASAAACVLFVGRVVGGFTRDFRFMLWNLTLAWVPYGLSLAATAIDRAELSRVDPLSYLGPLSSSVQHPLPRLARWRGPVRRRAALIAAMGVAWVAFFPNAPYLVTDLLHLRAWTPIPAWYDVGMLGMFAWSGCLLGVASLQAMEALAIKHAGRRAGFALVLLVAAASGAGIYLGRVVRLNSWDLLLNPGQVTPIVLSSMGRREGILFSLVFSGFFSVCYLTMRARRVEPPPAATGRETPTSAPLVSERGRVDAVA